MQTAIAGASFGAGAAAGEIMLQWRSLIAPACGYLSLTAIILCGIRWQRHTIGY
jgi:hypothetical protein